MVFFVKLYFLLYCFLSFSLLVGTIPSITLGLSLPCHCNGPLFCHLLAHPLPSMSSAFFLLSCFDSWLSFDLFIFCFFVIFRFLFLSSLPLLFVFPSEYLTFIIAVHFCLRRFLSSFEREAPWVSKFGRPTAMIGCCKCRVNKEVHDIRARCCRCLSVSVPLAVDHRRPSFTEFRKQEARRLVSWIPRLRHTVSESLSGTSMRVRRQTRNYQSVIQSRRPSFQSPKRLLAPARSVAATTPALSRTLQSVFYMGRWGSLRYVPVWSSSKCFSASCSHGRLPQ